MENELMSKAIVKRKEWQKKYQVSSNKIYEMFSEFSSMVLIEKKMKML